ncbi:hypothetical protein [Novosphingobium sp.]|uniref:hypothetical protein n=1 Tax=Novosphingobium sp. TaxID=1874826 RepID=UPI0025CCBEF8|nr:hypothetical protein [Novosphingobium sp.]MCC6924667.1 hypothetical protein [Novosphingobium sp.]
MLDVVYKRSNLVMPAIGCVLFAVGGGWVALQDEADWIYRLIGAMFALALPFVGYAAAARAASGVSAIRETASGLQLSTLYASTHVHWDQIVGIRREVLQQKSAFGLIKQNLGHYLVFEAHLPGEGELKVKIQEDLIDMPKARHARLFDQLNAMWAQGGSPQPVAPTRISPPVGAPRAAGFGRRGL